MKNHASREVLSFKHFNHEENVEHSHKRQKVKSIFKSIIVKKI